MSTPPKLTVASIVAATPEQVSSELAGETVILNLHDSSYYGLDEVGTRVWELIQKPVRIADVRDALLEEYEVEANRCEADLLALLGEMAERRLVTVHQAGFSEGRQAQPE